MRLQIDFVHIHYIKNYRNYTTKENYFLFGGNAYRCTSVVSRGRRTPFVATISHPVAARLLQLRVAFTSARNVAIITNIECCVSCIIYTAGWLVLWATITTAEYFWLAARYLRSLIMSTSTRVIILLIPHQSAIMILCTHNA